MQRLSPRFRSQQCFLRKICGEIFYPNLYLPAVLKKGSVNCAVKLFLLVNVSNKFDLINSLLDFLVFNFNLSLTFLDEGRGCRS